MSTSAHRPPRKEDRHRFLCRVLLVLFWLCLPVRPGLAASMEREVLESLSIPRITVSRVEKQMGDSYYLSYFYQNRESLVDRVDDEMDGEMKHFSLHTIAEAQQHLPFPIAQPTYQTVDYQLDEVLLCAYPDGVWEEAVTLQYLHVSRPSMLVGGSFSPNHIVVIEQSYAGTRATLEITTTYEISVLQRPTRSYILLTEKGYAIPLYSLIWLEGEYRFRVVSDDFDNAVQVAEGLVFP